jgi:hypothetical protein
MLGHNYSACYQDYYRTVKQQGSLDAYAACTVDEAVRLVTENRSAMVFDVPALRQIITEPLEHTKLKQQPSMA